MIADLRFPPGRKAFIRAAIILLVVFWMGLPRPGHHRPTLTGGALEIVIVFVTLALGAIASLIVIIDALRRPTPDRAYVYSWLAIAVLVGDLSLLVLGYWMRAIEVDFAHYLLAPALLAVTAFALGPPFIARALRKVRA